MKLFAYNKEKVENLLIEEKSYRLFNERVIDKKTFLDIQKNTADQLYSPGFFVRFGFLILTAIISLLIFGLGLLAAIDSGEKGIAILSLFSGIIGIFIAELFISEKKHFQSGIDDALLLLSGIAIVSFAGFMFNSERAAIIASVIVSAFLTIRYTHQVATITSVISIVFLVMEMFHNANPYLVIAIQLIPLAIIIIATTIAVNKGKHIVYFKTLQLLKYTAIITMYAFLNYLFINERFFYSFDIEINKSPTNLIWIATFLFPIITFIYAFRQKEIWLLRISVVLFLLSVIGFYQYYPFIPTEWALSIIGIIAIIKALFLIKYFNPFKLGYTSKPLTPVDSILQDQLGGAVITENITTPQPDGNSTKFGGGSFGGGGAWQDY